MQSTSNTPESLYWSISLYSSIIAQAATPHRAMEAEERVSCENLHSADVLRVHNPIKTVASMVVSASRCSTTSVRCNDG